jgi:hypothetical protein
MQSVDLGVMILVHKRPWPLPLIIEQILESWPNCKIMLTADRPTAEVDEVVGDAWGPRVGTRAAPFPVVDSDGEHFMAIRQWQLEELRLYRPRYIGFWDDDHLLESPDEAKFWMEKGVDIIDAEKAFFWNSMDNVNVKIPAHISPIFFKDRPGTAFPGSESRIIHTPVEIHDDPNSTRQKLVTKLLDVGYLFEGERARVWETYKLAGKIDAATMALVEEPHLKTFSTTSVYHRHLKESLLNGKK